MPKVQHQSPYRGLIPFEEEDAPFFYGREKEKRLIIANLFAAPLTLLCGASGVGKTSVLQAGVIHQLHQREDLLVVPFKAWQSDSAIIGLKNTVTKAAEHVAGESISISGSVSLADCLEMCISIINRHIMIILDQFEEFFLYNPPEGLWDKEFPKAVIQSESKVSFLISIREDSLAKLDRFEGHIPNLFENYLRIEHLNRAAAYQAIKKPIDQYNSLQPAKDQEFSIEPALIDAILEQIEMGKVVIGGAGHGIVETVSHSSQAEVQIETPYLQLVMTRLWDEELNKGSKLLRMSTFESLGGAECIVKTHLDSIMNELTINEQKTSARIFHYLVTLSGTKIAHYVSDLAEYAQVVQTQIEPVMKKLSGPEFRILSPVSSSIDQPGVTRYEIFHDVLAPAILDWRSRYLQRISIEKGKKQLKKRWIKVIAITLIFLLSAFSAYYIWQRLKLWGHVQILTTGDIYELKEDVVRIGRSTERIKNDISFIPRTISRRHFEIHGKDFLANDLLSLNGTTVNAEFLPYGQAKTLQDGDIVVLAGIAPFRFSVLPPEKYFPGDAWGIFIDGGARKIQYLRGDKVFRSLDKSNNPIYEYYLSLNEENRFIVESKRTPDTLLTIRRHKKNNMVTIEDQDDDIKLIAAVKEGDYEYSEYILTPGAELDYLTEGGELHDLFEAAYSLRGMPFQIVLTMPNLVKPQK